MITKFKIWCIEWYSSAARTSLALDIFQQRVFTLSKGFFNLHQHIFHQVQYSILIKSNELVTNNVKRFFILWRSEFSDPDEFSFQTILFEDKFDV